MALLLDTSKKSRNRFGAALCTAALCLSFVLPASAQRAAPPEPAAISTNRSLQLFTVLCALYASGFEWDVALANPHPLHVRLRQEMNALRGPAVDALREFYRTHRTPDPAITLSRYVSFALVTGPPPKFDYLLTVEQLPPDVRTLDGLTPVLAKFYEEAGIAQRWQQVAPEYEREIRRMQGPLSETVFKTAGYLREVVDQTGARQFTVYVELLVGAKTNLRNYGDRYAVVLSPGGDLPVEDIRHGFIHFLLDPIPYRHRGAIERLRPLLTYATRAPRFPAEYREQFPAYVVECLVRAVELRIRQGSKVEEVEALNAADADGYVLVRPLFERLKVYETAEPAMTFYFPDLLAGIHLSTEAARLEKVQFAPAQGSQAAIAEVVVQVSETERMLAAAESLIAERRPDNAAELFREVLGKEPQNPRALHGAGIAAVMLRDVDGAKALFQQVLAGRSQAAAPDPRWVAWSHVYLGRIYKLEGKRDLALTEFQAALAVENAPEGARTAARRELEQGQPQPPGLEL